MIQQSDEAIRDMENRARCDAAEESVFATAAHATGVLEALLWVKGEGPPPLSTEYVTAPEPFLPEDRSTRRR